MSLTNIPSISLSLLLSPIELSTKKPQSLKDSDEEPKFKIFQRSSFKWFDRLQFPDLKITDRISNRVLLLDHKQVCVTS